VLAVERTTKLFCASVKEALPDFRVFVTRSRTQAGRSNYVHIRDQKQPMYWKIRISDHPVGMRRAMSGESDLYIVAGAETSSWAVWLSELVSSHGNSKPPELFQDV